MTLLQAKISEALGKPIIVTLDPASALRTASLRKWLCVAVMESTTRRIRITTSSSCLLIRRISSIRDIPTPLDSKRRSRMPLSQLRLREIVGTQTAVMKDTSAQEWNFTVQRALSSSTTLSVGYLGNVGRHKTTRFDGNQPIAATPGSSRLNILPYPLLGGPITTQGNFVNSNYHSLVVTLNRQFRNGLSLLVNYTWSKALGYTSGDNDDVQDIYHLGY